jgi:hypothetical protein
MLKIKKGLANILEDHDNSNKPEEAPPQPSQTPQHIQTQSAQPPASAPRQVGDQIGWEEDLIQALAKAPDDVAQKLATCIDREVLLMALLKRRDDPYLKVALLILKK